MKMMFNKLGATLLLMTVLSVPLANANIIYAATMDDGPTIEEINKTLDKMQRAQLNQNIEAQEMILQLAVDSDDPVVIKRAEVAKLKIAEYKQELVGHDKAAIAAQEAEHQAYLSRQAFNTALAEENDAFLKEIGAFLLIVAGIFIIGMMAAVIIYNRISVKDPEKGRERSLKP